MHYQRKTTSMLDSKVAAKNTRGPSKSEARYSSGNSNNNGNPLQSSLKATPND